MKGVQEFLEWFATVDPVWQVVVALSCYVFLIVVARTFSRWLGGK